VVWAAAALVSLLIRRHPGPSITAGAIARGALLVWALDELLRGVHPWRRLLGTVVLAGIVASLVSV
jgi:hypothetical protein